MQKKVIAAEFPMYAMLLLNLRFIFKLKYMTAPLQLYKPISHINNNVAVVIAMVSLTPNTQFH